TLVSEIVAEPRSGSGADGRLRPRLPRHRHAHIVEASGVLSACREIANGCALFAAVNATVVQSWSTGCSWTIQSLCVPTIGPGRGYAALWRPRIVGRRTNGRPRAIRYDM